MCFKLFIHLSHSRRSPSVLAQLLAVALQNGQHTPRKRYRKSMDHFTVYMPRHRTDDLAARMPGRRPSLTSWIQNKSTNNSRLMGILLPHSSAAESQWTTTQKREKTVRAVTRSCPTSLASSCFLPSHCPGIPPRFRSHSIRIRTSPGDGMWVYHNSVGQTATGPGRGVPG